MEATQGIKLALRLAPPHSLQGMGKDDSRRAYMDIIQGWEGYGANLFEVEQTSNKAWPKELWLAISLQGVGIFPRNESVFLCFRVAVLTATDASDSRSIDTRLSSASVPLLPTSTRSWLTTSVQCSLRRTWFAFGVASSLNSTVAGA
jgi:hypothetical protein